MFNNFLKKFNDYHIKKKVLIGISLPTTLLIFVAIGVFINTTIVINNFQWVEHTNQVIADVKGLSKNLVDMETGERGYLFSGDKKFLEPYNNGKEEFQTKIGHLIEKVNDNPQQINRLKQLQTMQKQWDEEINQHEIEARAEINRGNTSLDSLMEEFSKARGKAQMDEMRAKIDEIIQIETKLNLIRTKNAHNAGLILILFTIIATLIALILSLIMGFKISALISKPLTNLIDCANKLARGDLKFNIELKSNDEVGQLIHSFKQIQVSNHEMIEKTNALSKGNLPDKMKKRSDNDEMVTSLNQCIDSIKSLISDVNILSEAAVEGKITTRIDVTRHQGDYRKITEGINETLDRVVGLLDNIPAPAMVIDNEFTIQYINDAGGRLNNKSGKQLIGTKCYNHFKTHDCRTTHCACAQSMNTDKDCHRETIAKPATTELDIKYQATPLKNKNGEIIGALEIVIDQTDIKTAMRKIEKINKYQFNEANKLTRALNQFAIGDMSFNLVSEDADRDTKEIKSLFDEINQAVDLIVEATNEIISKAKLIAAGDLAVQISKRSDNDELMIALSEMIEKLVEIVTGITDGAESISNASEVASSASQQLSQGTNEQAAAVEEVSASIEQMNANISQNTENALQTEKIATKSSVDIEQANKAVETTVKAMQEIASKISIINDIAEKTAILAINAAIEAARAGEHGKGFAVVAAEVRKLAENSKVAAREIGQVSEKSVNISRNAGGLLSQVVPDIQNTTRLVQEITAASSELDSGANQIGIAMNQLNTVVQQNAASAEEMAGNSEELAAEAETLQRIVSFFNIKT